MWSPYLTSVSVAFLTFYFGLVCIGDAAERRERNHRLFADQQSQEQFQGKDNVQFNYLLPCPGRGVALFNIFASNFMFWRDASISNSTSGIWCFSIMRSFYGVSAQCKIKLWSVTYDTCNKTLRQATWKFVASYFPRLVAMGSIWERAYRITEKRKKVAWRNCVINLLF